MFESLIKKPICDFIVLNILGGQCQQFYYYFDYLQKVWILNQTRGISLLI